MRLSAIREKAEQALTASGFQAGSWAWITGPNRLVVSVGGKVRIIDLPGRMAAAKLERVLGRIEAWGDMMGLAA